MTDNLGWQVFEDEDLPESERGSSSAPGRQQPAASIAATRDRCLQLGYGGFVIKRVATSLSGHIRGKISSS